MGDTTEMNFSSLENRLVEKNLEKDKSLAIKNVIQQSINEERIANNGLLINLVLHLAIVLLTSIIIWGKLNLVITYENGGVQKNRLRLNVIDFSFFNVTDSSISEFDYDCISKVNINDTYGVCHVDNSCNGLKEIMILFRDNICDDFIFLKYFGIIVKFNYIVSDFHGNRKSTRCY